MILSVRIDNFMVFPGDAELGLAAEDNITRLEDDVYSENGFKALKSVCVFGGNNSGKSCVVNAVKCIRDVILNGEPCFCRSAFSESGDTTCRLGVSFLVGGRAFTYDFSFDTSTPDGGTGPRGFVYERFEELFADGTSDLLFLRDLGAGEFLFKNEDDGGSWLTGKDISGFPAGRAFIYGADASGCGALARYKEILVSFAEGIEIIDADSLSCEKTISALAEDSPLKRNVEELINLADLGIEEIICDSSVGEGDVLRCRHCDQSLRPILCESAGTRKFIALAGYVVDAIKCGKTLVVDGLDDGLHFKLTRGLALLFNGTSNSKGGQLVFTAYDAMLLDCELLFRQDQIWFVCKDEDSVYLYSLAELGYSDDEIYSAYDLLEKYKHGDLGPIPRPDFPALDFDDTDTNG